MPELQYLDPESLPAEVRQPVLDAPLPSLTNGPKASELIRAMEAVDQGLASGGGERSEAARTVHAGLWLLAGELDRSHEISQSIESRDGSFWHGVMHRREGDYGNAQYWFRRAGSHPAYAALGKAIAADPLTAPLCDGTWDAVGFVGQCERAVRRGGELEQQCLHAQWIEWQIMMAACLGRA